MKPGDKVGRYELIELIGEGAMAQVFAARHPVFERRVALKILKREVCHDGHFVARFLDDARSAHGLDHPHVVRVLDFDEADGQPFIVMELIDGLPLDRWLAGRRVEVSEAVNVARDVARALAAAHGAGLVHRDVKPSNILIDRHTGTVKLTDFGAAKRERPGGQQLTEMGQRIGTPRYMAPEQVDGSAVDARTDLFALGATLYELLAGEPAFQGTTVSAVFHAILFGQPRPLAERRPDAPPELIDLVSRLLAKAPNDRPTTAEEVVAALGAISTRPGVAAQPSTGTPLPPTMTGSAERGDDEATPSWGGVMFRSRLVPAIAAAVVLLVVGVGAWWWLQAPAPEPAEAPTATVEPSDQEAQPPMAETESAPAVSEQEQAEAPAEQAAEPGGEQTAGVPEQEPQEQISAPEDQGAGSEEEQAVGAGQQAAAPEEPTAAPEEQAGALEEQSASVEEDQVEPAEQQAAVPEQAAAPEEQAAASEQQPAEPATPAAGPEPQPTEPEPSSAEQGGAPAEEGTEVAALTPGALDCPPESEAPGCTLAAQALRAIGGSAAAQPELMLNQPDGIYLDQEYLVVEAEMPAELGGYLYLDVLTDAGQVFHLLPEPMREDNELPAGGDIRVGVEEAERAAGVRHWQVGGPFSEGYLLATVSEKRLYEGLRPLEESIADYREILLQSLADPDTGRKAASVERLEFRPRQ